MDSERSLASSSNSSYASSSVAADAAADRMVRIELEAAEALADLAQLAMRENGSCDSGGKWGSKGKRAKKRVKIESPPDDSGLNPVVDSVPTCSDPVPQDRAVVDRQCDEPICRNAVISPSGTEQDADLPKAIPSCVRIFSSCGGGRSRQTLTEDEKEARRLRRILANRESARQTIRRRQALCEELTKKAADLTWENENLKRKKELALKDYQSLELTNKHLKEQMAKVIKAEEEESPGDHKSACSEMPTNRSMNCPFLIYNQHPFSPLSWPSIIQSPNPVQSHHGPQNSIIIPSNIPMPANGKLDSSQQQQETPINLNKPRTPLYIVSCPWFFPVADNGFGHHPQSSFGLKPFQDETSLNHQCSGSSSSKGAAHMESQHSFLPVKVKSEAASSTEVRIIHDLNETPVGFPPDGGGQCVGSLPKEMNLTRVPPSSVMPTISVKNEAGPQSEHAPITDGLRSKVGQQISSLQKNREPFEFPSKKLLDSAAAAEARKRRKELTKLKNFHGRRQFRMNC